MNRLSLRNIPVEIQDFKRITDHFRGIYRIYPNILKENRRMLTCNWWDLQTLGSKPVVPKNLPDPWSWTLWPAVQTLPGRVDLTPLARCCLFVVVNIPPAWLVGGQNRPAARPPACFPQRPGGGGTWASRGQGAPMISAILFMPS